MADKKEAESALEKVVNDLAAKVRRMEDKVERHSANWRRFVKRHVDTTGKSTIDEGFSRVGVMLSVASFAALVLVGSLVAEVSKPKPGVAPDKFYAGTVAIRANGDIVTEGEIVGTNSAGGVNWKIGTNGVITSSAIGGGTAVVSTATVSDTGRGDVRKTVITLASLPVTVLYGGPVTNSSGGSKIYVFPEGRISVLGVIAKNLTTATNINFRATNNVDYAVGTTVGSGGTLTTTEVDLCPTNGMIQATNDMDNALAAAAQFDGTSTKKDVYLNQTIAYETSVTSPVTNLISGEVTIHWLLLGDY